MRRICDQISISKVKIPFISMLTLSLSLTLLGCYPLAVDDFTALNNDVLSNLVRNSYSKENKTSAGYGALGVSSINKSKFELLAKNLFVGQERNEIEETFVKNGGECILNAIQKSILCSFVRKWKLKNVGGKFDTVNWSDPAAKIEITFIFNEQNRMQNLSLEIIDVTKYKEIRG